MGIILKRSSFLFSFSFEDALLISTIAIWLTQDGLTKKITIKKNLDAGRAEVVTEQTEGHDVVGSGRNV